MGGLYFATNKIKFHPNIIFLTGSYSGLARYFWVISPPKMNYTNKNSRILKSLNIKYYLHVLINNTSKMHIPLALALALALALI